MTPDRPAARDPEREFDEAVKARLAARAQRLAPADECSVCLGHGFHQTATPTPCLACNSTGKRADDSDRVMVALARALKACGVSTADGAAIAEIFIGFWQEARALETRPAPDEPAYIVSSQAAADLMAQTFGGTRVEVVEKLTPYAAPDEPVSGANALRELVACKDLKERYEAAKRDPTVSTQEMQAWRDEYERRQPLAWEAARTALATAEPTNSKGATVDTAGPSAEPRKTLTDEQKSAIERIHALGDEVRATSTAPQPVHAEPDKPSAVAALRGLVEMHDSRSDRTVGWLLRYEGVWDVARQALSRFIPTAAPAHPQKD